MRNDSRQKNYNKSREKTKLTEKKLNNYLNSELTGLGEQIPTIFKLVANFFGFILLWVLSVTAHLKFCEAMT